MKKFFITGFAMITFNLSAQIINPLALQMSSSIQATNPLDSQLINVDQSAVTSGIIYERSHRTTNLFAFNQPNNWHHTANFDFFKQVLGELHYASNRSRLISVDNLNIINQNNIRNNEVNVGIINSSLEVLNFDSVNQSNGGLAFNGTTYSQIRGKVPFYSLQATVIAPLQNTVSGNTITYKFANNLIFNNGAVNVLSLTGNFGDGINRTIIENGVLTASSFTVNNSLSNQTQKIIFTITYSNNVQITTYGEIFISKDVSSNATNRFFGPNSCNLDPDIEDIYSKSDQLVAEEGFKGLNETIAIKGKLEVKVFYNIAHQRTIRKPILILDGFDPGDKRKITDCDCENDPTGDCQYNNRNKITNNFDPQNHKSLLELMSYNDSAGRKKDLIPILRTNGFDVVVINQPNYVGSNGAKIDGGADYIERNGLALVSLIKNINSRMLTSGSTEQIIIIGPSMGGQISRYALAFMEKNNIPHNTKLWVAFDSPNLGANAPLGDQALLNILRDEGANAQAQDSYANGLNSIASKELMIELHQQPGILNDVNLDYLNASTISQGMPIDRGNPYFQSHFNNQFANGLPNSKGYPINLRKIAITNGSLTGKRSEGNDREFMLDARYFTQACYRPFNILGWRPSICYTTKLATAQASLLPEIGGTTEIASLKKLTLAGQYTQATNYNFRGNLDLVPGGLTDATGQIYDQITNTGAETRGSFWQFPIDNLTYWYINSFGEGSQWEKYALVRNQCFIPTFSSLGIKNPNQNWANPLDRNLVCTNETVFDSYYGEVENTDHVLLNQNSVEWLLKELGSSSSPGNPQAPHFPIQENALTGEPIVCVNQNTTYTIADICKVPSPVIYQNQNGATVNGWSVSSNLQIVASTPYSVTVASIGAGARTVSATFQNGQKIDKQILFVNKPSPATMLTYSNIPYDSSQLNGPYWNPTWFFKSTNLDENITEFIFRDLNNNFLATKSPNSAGMVEISASELGMGHGATLSFYVYTKNVCGEIITIKKRPIRYTVYYPTLCELGIGAGCHMQRIGNSVSTNIFTIFPNPATDIINIELRSKTDKPDNKANITAALYNLMGQEKAKIKINNNKASIPTATLPKGLYVLHINIDGNIETHHIGLE